MKIEDIGEVVIGDQRFAITDFRHYYNGFKSEDILTLRSVGPQAKPERPKQDIRDYCQEHRCWAAKDGDGDWGTYNKKPSFRQSGSVWTSGDGWIRCENHFTFPDCPWDKSLIAPDGSMPLMEPKHKDSIRFGVKSSLGTPAGNFIYPHRGDPIFVWDDIDDPRCPAIILYFHHTTDGGGAFCFVSGKYGKGATRQTWDHYRSFDVTLVGVPRRDWPEAHA